MIAGIIALVMLVSAAGCGAPDTTASFPAASAGVPVSSAVPTEDAGTSTGVAEESVPVTEPAEETDAAEEPEDTEAPAASTEPVEEVDNRTEDEKLVDSIVSACSTQAAAETDFSACVVDIRTAVNPYDVKWDYGNEYDDLAFCGYAGWDYVFDAEYYKETFPMLAMLYHDNDVMLKIHFTTAGIHEGRQGNADFNVKAFMESCPRWIREAFGDNYACYYLYYIHSTEVDRTADVSGNGYPKQMTAVMTAVQKEEFDLINYERKRLGREPLVFDSELATIANYRAWINADGNWAAHDWAKQHNSECWDMVYKIGGDTLSENTSNRFRRSYHRWYYNYYSSKPHYEAMMNTEYRFVGDSNVYACDNTLEQYANWDSDIRLIHFDVFMGELDTALNPK